VCVVLEVYAEVRMSVGVGVGVGKVRWDIARLKAGEI